MNRDYYQLKSPNYGINKTRLSRVLKLIGNPSAKRVLDIGCSTGYLGEKLKQAGASYVAGVEISEVAAREADKKLDRTWSFNLQDIHWPETLMTESFDIIIMAELLEHIFEPVDVLKKVYRLLRPDGCLIITTPNFMTWTNRIKFLFGRFKYQNEGMFDFGHIRFFTYPYLKQVLRERGFTIKEEQHIIFPGKATRFLKLWPGLFAFQFVVKAKKD